MAYDKKAVNKYQQTHKGDLWQDRHPQQARDANKKCYKKHKQQRLLNIVEYNEAHPDQITLNRQRHWQRIRTFIDRVKLRCGCSVCGYKKCARALDFHHKDDKVECITALSARVSREKLKQEMRKCIILCANCHREYHYNSTNKE